MTKEVKAAWICGICTIIGAIIGSLLGIYCEAQKSNYDKEEYNKKIIEIEGEYNNLISKFESLENEYNSLILQNNAFSPTDISIDNINKTDQLEIDQIIKRIDDFRDYTQEYPNFETDLYEIELMYKMFLSEEYYKYKNIILAFKQYGVNCDELLINENILELWDIEILYTYYNMYNNIEGNERKIYSFDEYKMKEIDTFNYHGHSMIYSNDTYNFIYKDLENRINKIIRKMNRNLLPIMRYI